MSLKPPVDPNVPIERSETLNLWDYGGNGDNATDNTAAFMNAWNALSAGQSLYVPPGDYQISNSGELGTLTKSDVRLVGAGRGISRLINRGTDGQHFLMFSGDDVTVQDLTIDGNRSNQLTDTGVALDVASTTPASPVRRFKAVNLEIIGCGFGCMGFWNCESSTLSGCDLSDVYDTALQLTEGTRLCSFVGNTIYLTDSAALGRWAIGADTADLATYGRVRDCLIANNHVYMNAGTDSRQAILLQTTEGIVVANNMIRMDAIGTAGIRADDDALHFQIVGNTVTGTQGSGASYGIQVFGTDTQAKRGVVANNITRDFFGGARAGIQLDTPVGVTVRDNVAIKCQRGVNVEGTNALPVSGVLVEGNHAYDCDTGFRFGGGSSSASVAEVGPNFSYSHDSFRYALDEAWTIRLDPRVILAPGTTDYVGSATKLGGGPLNFAIAASKVASGTLFVDAADSAMKFRTLAGATQALY